MTNEHCDTVSKAGIQKLGASPAGNPSECRACGAGITKGYPEACGGELHLSVCAISGKDKKTYDGFVYWIFAALSNPDNHLIFKNILAKINTV